MAAPRSTLRSLWSEITAGTPVVARSPVRRPARIQEVVWVALVTSSVFLAVRDYDSLQVGSMQDDAIYVLLARALVFSGRFEIPGDVDGYAAQFPPGFPLILAPLVAAFPADLGELRLPSLAATVSNAALLFWGWRWFSRVRSFWWASAISGLYLLSPYVVAGSRQVMSEPVFTLLCLVAWILVERSAEARPKSLSEKPQSASLQWGRTFRARWNFPRAHSCRCAAPHLRMRTFQTLSNGWSGVWVGLTVCGAAITRTVGWLLVPCVAAYVVLRLRRQAWVPLALACAGMVAVIGGSLALAGADLSALGASPIAYSRKLIRNTFSSKRTEGGQMGLSRLEFWGGRFHRHVTADLRGLIVPLGGGRSEAALFARLGMPSPMPLLSYGLLGLIVVGAGRWYGSEGLSIVGLFAVAYGFVLAL